MQQISLYPAIYNLTPLKTIIFHENISKNVYNKVLSYFYGYSLIHHEKKRVKWDINYNFSEKATMTTAAKIVSRKDAIGKI
jgi:hypothetical protein